MPSVGMRRTPRVFGVVKGVDGARVLRSGRRLWPESGELKLKNNNNNNCGDEWFHNVIKKPNNNNTTNTNRNHTKSSNVKCKELWASHNLAKLEQKVVTQVPKRVKSENLSMGERDSKMYGIYYTRKRKRLDVEKQGILEDKMYGIHFTRRQRRKSQGDGESLVGLEFVAVVLDASCSEEFASFLRLVLGYIKRVSLRLSHLAAFLLSEPITGVFASSGIRFLYGPPNSGTGVCKFFRANDFVPMFSVDFSAIPLCFMYMHVSLVLKFKCLSLVPVNNSLDEDEDDEIMSKGEKDHSCVPLKMEITEARTVVSEADNSGNKMVLHPSVRGSKLAGRNTQYRNGLNSRGIQKRRSSLRQRRARNPSLVGMHKANGALVSDLISSRKDGIPFSSVVSKNKIRSSVRSSSVANLKEASSAVVGVTGGVALSSCSANILVIEADRCYRIEGATIMLELSDSNEWVLVVKKDGSTRYTHLAQKSMRPCASNRITHGIIWTGDENWKLEFPNRQDWFIFKDLYKECADRNVPASVSKVIPVPGVREVLEYEDYDGALFCRPDAYISISNDEVARALAKRTANYDMDSEDEAWLKRFNNELLAESEHQHLSEGNFELMIDAFEKAFYCSPDDFTDEKAAVNLCIELGKTEVVEAVYSYWMKKWKQKRSALLRVFQGYQAKKAPLIPKPVLRKRRSLKRQFSQFGRGKQPSVLQAMAAEQDALEEMNAMRKVEDAKISLKRSLESAILKRRRAQMLMENANLATYKAAMALIIAEVARAADSTNVAVTHFLD